MGGDHFVEEEEEEEEEEVWTIDFSESSIYKNNTKNPKRTKINQDPSFQHVWFSVAIFTFVCVGDFVKTREMDPLFFAIVWMPTLFGWGCIFYANRRWFEHLLFFVMASTFICVGDFIQTGEIHPLIFKTVWMPTLFGWVCIFYQQQIRKLG